MSFLESAFSMDVVSEACTSCHLAGAALRRLHAKAAYQSDVGGKTYGKVSACSLDDAG